MAAEPDVARVPVMIDSSQWAMLEAGLKCVQGKSIVNSISLKEGEEKFLAPRPAGPPLRRRLRGDDVRRARAGGHRRAQGADRPPRLSPAHRAGRACAPADIIFDPNILTVGTGIEEHNRYALNFIEAARQIKQLFPEREDLRRREQRLLRLPQPRAGPPGDARRVPLPRDPRRAGHGDRQRRPVGRVRGDPAGPAASASRTCCWTAGPTPPSG